jgi:hypothetical protein
MVGFGRALIFAVLAVILASAAHLLDNRGQMRPYYMVPYLSGAAQFEFGQPWVFSRSAYQEFREMSIEEQEDYRFERRTDVEPFSFLNIGYLYIAAFAHRVFFWKGGIEGLELFQVLIHILITLVFLQAIRSRAGKWLFFVVYGLNPLVLHYVTFPFYYFWQAIPSAALALYLIRREWRFGWTLLPIAILLGIVIIARPTVVLVLGLLFVIALRRERARVAVLAIAVFAIAVAAFNANTVRSSPWHTMYIGVGGYPNQYGIAFSDRAAMDYFEQKTGIEVDHSLDGDWLNEEIRHRYSNELKDGYLQILKDRPLMLVRNALLNFFAAFAAGYLTPSLTLTYISSLLGFIFAVFLLLRRKFLFAVAIAAASLTFSPYCPPVPHYLFGSYILIASALVASLEDTRPFEWADRLLRRPFKR